MSAGIQPAAVQGTPTMGSSGRKKRDTFASWLEPQSDLYSLKNRVVFTTGEHKGRTYTKADLADMVRAFEPTLNQLKPRVKLGHDEAQSYARLAFGKLGTDPDEKSLGMPALGYVDNLRLNADYTDRNGKKHEAGTELLADFVNLDAGLYRDLMALRYPERSAEVLHNYRDKERPGTVWPRALQNVAFLGDELPAVRGMAPLVERNSADLTSAEVDVVTFRFSEGDEDMAVEMPPGVPGKPATTLDELAAQVAELKAAMAQVLAALKKDIGADEGDGAPMAQNGGDPAMLAAKAGAPADKPPAEPKPEMNAAVPGVPAMPMAQTPGAAPAKPGDDEKGATTVHIHAEQLTALEKKLETETAKRIELETRFAQAQSEQLMKQAKQEAETFAESLSRPENMRIPAAMKGEVARLYQNAPDVQKFSDTGKSYKEELAALLGKLPLLAKPQDYQSRHLTLIPRGDEAGQNQAAEVVKFAEDKARELAAKEGIPFAQALYRFSHSPEMSPEKLVAAFGAKGNNGTAGV